MYIRGDSGTGKSTILQLVSAMFPSGSTGAISSTYESKFGLEGLHEKRLILIPDVPEKMSKVLDQQVFQSMCSGEMVLVARKNKTSVSQLWTTPMLAAANWSLDYKDNGGQIARRIAMFDFKKLVERSDGKLKKKIAQTELVTIMIRCLVKYHRMVAVADGRKFDDFCPEQMKEARADISIESNPLASFIASGDDRYQVVFREGSVTSLTKLSMVFSSHMKNVHRVQNASIGQDRHPILAAGYTEQIQNVCKICEQKQSRETCGSHYNTANRSRKIVFLNMDIKVADY
jgi:phage/plasmid-associated DNA primase